MDLTAEEYCRQVEAYLCRKNDGHLVRIVGPAFEQVCGWATRGVPIKVACRGIDRYFERYYAKGPRRRPVRIDFCEADVLDVFDEWRRAVGIPATVTTGADDGGEPAVPSVRHPSLPAHLDRVIARLTVLRAGADRSLDPVVDSLVRELDAARAAAKSIRGEARQALVQRLREMDGVLLEAARARCEGAELDRLAADADAELAPFRDRMPRIAYDQAKQACIDRLLRDRGRLPVVTYE
jgi:hypothetical protein